MSESKVDVWRGCIVTYDGEHRYQTERDVVSVDDWRDTIMGPVNFGYRWLGPRRMVRIAA